MATLDAAILAYAPGTNVSKAHLLEEKSHRVTRCSFTSFLVAVTTQIIVIFDQNRGSFTQGVFISVRESKSSTQKMHACVHTHAHTHETGTDGSYRATFNMCIERK